MMDITVLGSSASAPTPQRSLPSIAVQINGDIILLDCGEGAQRQMMLHGASYAKVKAALISHLHLDHFLGLFGLGETLRLSGRVEPIKVFGPPGTRKFLYSFGHREIFDVHEITKADCSKKKPLHIMQNHQIFCFPASHGKRTNAFGYIIAENARLRFHEKKAKSLGLAGPLFSQIQKKGKLKIGKRIIRLKDITYLQKGLRLAYSGDSLPCAATTTAAKNADLLIHDCTFDDSRADLAKEKFHTTASQAAKIAKIAKAKSLLLTHIGGKYSKDASILLEQAKKIFPNSQIAQDGMKITLK
ncbi:ribonuclease [Candidatus Micrarchaeota archaeon CG10_big_fil_rev_8_21_14_0_10_45_29]|nr:MAG: ribonuclease [Candidatus Micrarchaeota archaeon CG10_big_fil_rev_8_21_14_0_10_45_29]